MFIREVRKVSSADPAESTSSILARRLYDGSGDAPLADRVIEIESGRIIGIRAAQAGDDTRPGTVIADIVTAGFIDLQINGANDTQFNDEPTPEALDRIARGARRGGTAHLLPTFMTAPGRRYRDALDAGRSAIEGQVPGILGVHLEGPFLSPERPGIHEASAIREPDADDIANLVAPFPGVVLVTLAPERQTAETIATLAGAGVVVFAGHSAAPGEVIARCENEGLRGVTHLFNAMSQMSGREPGVVGAALASEGLFAGIIADGHHVAWSNVAIAARLMPDRLCLVSDAMLTFAGRITEFDLHGETIRLAGGRLTNADGRLAGAHVAMDESVRNLVGNIGLPVADALRMASANPARALRLDHELGRVQPGFRASLTLLDDRLCTTGVVVDGAVFLQAAGR